MRTSWPVTGRGVGPAYALLVVLVAGAVPTTVYRLLASGASAWPGQSPWLLVRERMTGGQWAGIGLVFSGVAGLATVSAG